MSNIEYCSICGLQKCNHNNDEKVAYRKFWKCASILMFSIVAIQLITLLVWILLYVPLWIAELILAGCACALIIFLMKRQ